MQRIAAFASMIFLPLVLLAFAPGCTKETPVVPRKPVVAKKPEVKTPLDTKRFGGVIEGKLVYDGEPPVMPFLTGINDHGDKVGCLKGSPAETHKQTWAVNPQTKALANVVIWVEPPPGKYYSLREEDKKRAGETVVIDQPHCVFLPHVVTVFPSYFDGKEQVKTGQKLQIKNSATFRHSVQWNPTRENDALSKPIPPNDKIEIVLNPQKSCLAIGCGDHNWMQGIIWIFDHPYHTVSKEDGAFRIDNLPTDVELTFKAWHESRVEPFEQRPITLKEGKNPPIELKLKK